MKIIIWGIIITVIIIIIICVCVIRFKKIKYYICVEKPNTELLDGILKKNGISRNDKSYNFYMPCGYNDVERELKTIELPKSKYIFGLIGCDKIVSKNNLWDILEINYGRHGAKQLMPESFIIDKPEQYSMAIKEVKNGSVLICKKNIQRKLGLKLVFNLDDLNNSKKDNFKVAQIFIQVTMRIRLE